jgi:aspartate kinase
MLVVQKYGGTSVGTAERIRAVAQRVSGAKDAGNTVVVVVSARGDTTDELIEMARQITPEPDERELDVLLSTGETVACTLLAMALRAAGREAVSLSGGQAGIRTESRHGRARIIGLEPRRILRELSAGRIVIVAGFQGVSAESDITTLGRGGSDTTAVALAAALKADLCEIYTDVDGVYSADPRVVPEARLFKEISYEEILELASLGARVMHPRAVEIGWVYGVPIVVRSSFNDHPGTLIHGEMSMEDRNKVVGIAHDADVARITVTAVPDRPGVAYGIFQPLADAGVSVDVIVQSISHDGKTDLSFTVARGDLAKALRAVEPAAAQIGASQVVSDDSVAKVSIVGGGMTSAPGYAATMFKALADAGINIQVVTTSDIRITCLIARASVKEAVRALHRAFVLEH